MRIKPFRATFPKLDSITDPNQFFAEAKSNFPDYKRQGLLVNSELPALFIYQIEDAQRRHTGLIALNDVQDFFSGKIKHHENTLSEREQQQIELFLSWGAMIKPVLLTYNLVPEISAWIQRQTRESMPLLEVYFDKEQQTHRIWMAPGQADWQYLKTLFEQQVPAAYIADGHHRMTSLGLLHRLYREQFPELDFDHLLCAYFSTDQLDILDYNRVVEGLNGLPAETLFARLSDVFDITAIENPRKPRKKHELKMYFRGHWYRLHWKPGALLGGSMHNPALLDVILLNELILHRLLGIGDVRTDERILYVEGSKGLKGIRKTVGKNADRIGFALHPVTFPDMMCMADAGENLPPKSTYFAPRLKSGMLIKLF